MRKSHVNPSFLFKFFATPVLVPSDISTAGSCAYWHELCRHFNGTNHHSQWQQWCWICYSWINQARHTLAA